MVERSGQAGRTAATGLARPPVDLIGDYRPGDFFLASRNGMLLATGSEDAGASGETAADPAGRIRAMLAAAKPGSLVVGAIPFDANRPACLTVPRVIHRGPPPRAARSSARHPGPVSVHAEPAPEVYTAGVRTALARMSGTELEKVVLARSLAVNAGAPVEVAAVLRALAGPDPFGYTFAVGLGDSTLVGASPELLVSRRGNGVFANPLAGTRPRHADPVRDGRHATSLLGSAKDRLEHGIVVEAIADGLRPFVRKLTVSAPELLPTSALWHLSTRISGELVDDEVSSADLALALHPTPAVCGTPPSVARDTITEIETFDRGFYTGLVGWCDDTGDGEWVVAIRCGAVHDDTVRLFAGAGIVPGSRPEEELAETSAKFRTLMSALGYPDEDLGRSTK
ncbi:isochorismate synthase [Amycolatopsis nigrescens]|uniref:isochorismate synthase n=1 Tax=Amycolatopsis nigrescens TaxID=381445 RepID=UPI000365EFA6|nr:isochorismate synthase [Amycolatopsis nigrescens]